MLSHLYHSANAEHRMTDGNSDVHLNHTMGLCLG